MSPGVVQYLALNCAWCSKCREPPEKKPLGKVAVLAAGRKSRDSFLNVTFKQSCCLQCCLHSHFQRYLMLPIPGPSGSTNAQTWLFPLTGQNSALLDLQSQLHLDILQMTATSCTTLHKSTRLSHFQIPEPQKLCKIMFVVVNC